MTTEMILGITGTVTGVLGLVLSFRQHLLDKPDLKVTAKLKGTLGLGADEGRLILTISVVNEGRRPIVLRNVGVLRYNENKKKLKYSPLWELTRTVPLAQSFNDTIKLEENERHDYILDPFDAQCAELIGKIGTAYVIDTRGRYYFAEFNSLPIAEMAQKLQDTTSNIKMRKESHILDGLSPEAYP